jgi:hypothetical protein
VNKPNSMQPPSAATRKTSNQLPTQQALRKPTAPPVYRPQTAPRALQPKIIAPHQPAHQSRPAPVAPSAYSPAPTPHGGVALQPKSAPNHKLVSAVSFPPHQASVIQRANDKKEVIGPNTTLRLKEHYGSDKTYSDEGGLFIKKVGLT